MVLIRVAGEALILAIPSIRATWALYHIAGRCLLAYTLAACVSVASFIAVTLDVPPRPVTPGGDQKSARTTADAADTHVDSANALRSTSTAPAVAFLNAMSWSEACVKPDSDIATRDVDGIVAESSTSHHLPEEPSGRTSSLQPAQRTALGCSESEPHKQQQQQQRRVEIGQHGDTTAAISTRRRPSEFSRDQPQHNTTTVNTGPKRSRPYRRGGEVLYIAEGVAEAVVGIVRDPVRGAQGEGAKGLVKGIGSGVVGVVTRPVRGVARAGQNAYTGVKIGVSRARGGSKGGSTSASPMKSSKESASLPVDTSDAEAVERIVIDRNGSTPDRLTAIDSPAVRDAPTEVASATGVDGVKAGGSSGSKKAVSRLLQSPRQPSALSEVSPFDGLVVAISTVPLVLSSLYLLISANEKGRPAFSAWDGWVEEPVSPMECDGSDECWASHESQLALDGAMGVSMATWSCEGESVGSVGGPLVMLGYVEALLEGSILCAASEAVLAIQRVVKPQRPSAVWSKVLMNGPLRLTLLAAACTWHCRRPLLPLWCLAVYDLLRRALDAGGGRVTTALSLRQGEAAVLAHAVALWTVDAALFTIQELWVPDSAAWKGMFPPVPFRSGGMVIVQTGLLGTLVTGGTLAVARAFMPTSWSSDVLGDMVTYGVVITGTAGWLERWTTPLLGSNPVTWAVLYALGLSVPERQPSFAYSLEANGNDEAEIVLVHNPTVNRSELSFSAGASMLFQRMFFSLPEETNAEVGEGDRDTGSVDSPGLSLSRPLLVAGWLLVLAGVVPAVPMLAERFGLSNVQSRKVFHALATVMFLPALALEPEFLSLALGTAMGALLVAEYLRCAACPPLAGPLNRYFSLFLDARDGGCLVVTHLFLVLGCAIPIWASGLVEHAGILPYAGVIIVGVGDAMGAVIGSSLGQHRWPSSRRTLEGSAAVFLSSLLALVVCASFATSKGSSTSGKWDGGDWSWWKYCAGVAWPVALASLAEAFTSQVDNLVLPCVLLGSLALQQIHEPSGSVG